MKKYFILASLFVFGGYAFAAYCPAVDEFSQETIKIQQKGLNMYKESQKEDSKADVDPMDLIKESNDYINNVVNDCITYFRTTPEPDCSKFHSLSTAYIIMGLTNKEGAQKIQFNMNEIREKCPSEFSGLEQVQQQFDNKQIKY